MVLKGVRKFLAKYLLGVDCDEQDRYIKILEKQNKKLKQENQELKNKIEFQEQLIQDLNTNLQKITKGQNFLVETHVYFQVVDKFRSTEFGFDFYISGVVDSTTNLDAVSDYFSNNSMLEQLGNLFNKKGGWDKMIVKGTNVSGFNYSLSDREVSRNFDVSLEIDGNGYGTRTIKNIFNEE